MNDPGPSGGRPNQRRGWPALGRALSGAWGSLRRLGRRGWQRGHPALRTARRVLLRLFGLLAALVFLLVILVGAAGWYTSRSEFCNSCHIMEPYYVSWAESKHNHVDCIECHFAPGFGGKLRGKMLGLVQLAKYVTRNTPPGFQAEIPDASCLRSGCHETRLLSGRVDYQGIPFDHGPHLAGPRRDIDLRCTSCHSQIVQGPHMTVVNSTCFLCHFKGEPFNARLSACTHCHSIPKREFQLGGGAVFTHRMAVEKGVSCVNCHRDVIRGRGEVNPERCQSCHNRPSDIQQIGRVVFLHAKHVGEHEIDCLRCHRPIAHSLDTQRIVDAASDCASCHPDHHRPQVEMFLGAGAKTGPREVGSMLVARVDCLACHRTRQTGPGGEVVLEGSLQVCSMCHVESAVTQFQDYHQQLRRALPAIQAGLDRAQAALAKAGLAADRQAALRGQLEGMRKDLNFVRLGNGIHNIHYASTLVHTLLDQTAALDRQLNVAPPSVTLPSPPTALKPSATP